MHLQKKLPSFILGSSGKVLVVPTPLQVHKENGGQVKAPTAIRFILMGNIIA